MCSTTTATERNNWCWTEEEEEREPQDGVGERWWCFTDWSRTTGEKEVRDESAILRGTSLIAQYYEDPAGEYLCH